MISYTTGNLLDAQVDAVVNTVNTKGVMGKGIALMFKEAFPENFKAYASACKQDEVIVGKMFVTQSPSLTGPRYIINFPTKKHWIHPSKLEYVTKGLEDLVRIIRENKIHSIALPPLGCGNGGLEWDVVKKHIEGYLGQLPEVDVLVYEPTQTYQNKSKTTGVEKLTPSRAMLLELIRRYSVLGFECSNLEIHKLAYFLQRFILGMGLKDVTRWEFKAAQYGPYAENLRHTLDALDGSYLHAAKRLADAGALEPISLNIKKAGEIEHYVVEKLEQTYLTALQSAEKLIDGFETPFLMELLATVDWVQKENPEFLDTEGVMAEIANWDGGGKAAERKKLLFPKEIVGLAIKRLWEHRSVLYPA